MNVLTREQWSHTVQDLCGSILKTQWYDASAQKSHLIWIQIRNLVDILHDNIDTTAYLGLSEAVLPNYEYLKELAPTLDVSVKNQILIRSRAIRTTHKIKEVMKDYI